MNRIKSFSFFIFAFSLFPAVLFAQTSESNSLYATGVELYKAQKYKEAIPYFEKSDSIDKATLSEASCRQDYSSMWLASCWYKLGEVNKAKDLSEYYFTEPIDRRLTIKSDSLAALSAAQNDAGDILGAAEAVKKCAEQEHAELGRNTFWEGNSWANYFGYLANLENLDTITMWKAADKARTCYRSSTPYFYRGLGNIDHYQGIVYMFLGKNEMALPLFNSSLQSGYKCGNGKLIYDSYMMLQIYFQTSEEFKHATTEAVDSAMKLLYAPDIKYFTRDHANILTVGGIADFMLGKYKESHALLTANEKLYKSFDDEITNARFFNDLFALFAGEKVESDDLQELCAEFYDRYDSTELCSMPAYSEFLIFYLRNGGEAVKKFDARWNIIQKINNIARTVYGENSTPYVQSLIDDISYFGNDASTALNYSRSELDSLSNLTNEIDRLIASGVAVKDNYMVKYLNLKSSFLVLYGNKFDDAIKLKNQAISIIERNGTKGNGTLADMYVSLSDIYLTSGNMNKQYEYLRKAYDIYNQSDSLKQTGGYLSLLNRMSTNSKLTGNYDEGKKIDNQIMALGQKGKTSDDINYQKAEFDRLLNVLLNKKDDWDDATVDSLNTVYNRMLEKDPTSGIEAEFKLAGASFTLEDYESAERFLSDMINDSNMVNFVNTPIMSTARIGLARAYRLNNKDTLALQTIDEAVNTIKSARELNEQYLIMALTEKLDIINSIGAKNTEMMQTQNYKDAVYDCASAIDSLLRSYITKNFLLMTSKQREQFWNITSDWFMNRMPNLAGFSNDDRFIPLVYNGMLLSKGLLLNSELEVRRIISESGNKEALALYNEMEKDYERLNQIGNSDKAMSEKLSGEIQSKERRLMQLSSEYGDYTKRLTLTWEDVRDNLKEGEAAMEISEFNILGVEVYHVFIVTPNCDLPKICYLMPGPHLDSIPSDSYYSTTKLYDYFWKDMIEMSSYLLDNAKTLYISPIGRFYGIALEYAMMPDGQPVNTKYNIYRVSSTREIALRNDKKSQGNGSVLYGGINYDALPSDIETANRKANVSETASPEAKSSVSRAAIEDDDLDGGVPYLKGTLKEVEDIDNLFKDSNKKAIELVGSNGTEESVKALSEHSPQLLHIATHGFYWNGKGQTTDDGMVSLLSNMSDGNNNTTQEDKMLTRSGLLLAGANNVLRGTPVPSNIDDGILTAKEISQLDLRGLDLVVLSACETGLGEISGDGVFGLQRGFKKAGAQTLLMSLWKVDDEATQLLMTDFYRNLLAGDSKTAALAKAQQHLRTVDHGRFNDPRYWAAFILLDAVEDAR